MVILDKLSIASDSQLSKNLYPISFIFVNEDKSRYFNKNYNLLSKLKVSFKFLFNFL